MHKKIVPPPIEAVKRREFIDRRGLARLLGAPKTVNEETANLILTMFDKIEGNALAGVSSRFRAKAGSISSQIR